MKCENTNASHEEFIVKVRVEKGNAPGIVRVRRWLKAGLRGYGLRCVEAKPVESEQAQEVDSK